MIRVTKEVSRAHRHAIAWWHWLAVMQAYLDDGETHIVPTLRTVNIIHFCCENNGVREAGVDLTFTDHTDLGTIPQTCRVALFASRISFFYKIR